MLKYILVGILAMLGYYAWTFYPVSHGPGVVAPDKPKISYTAWDKPFSFKGNTLTPIKDYSATVRVLGQKRYFFDDKKDLAPVDLVVGWNEMSDERNLEFVQVSLKGRSFQLNYTKPPIKDSRMYNQMEHLHLIPSTREIEKTISWLRAGTILAIKGKVVNLESTNDYNWNSEILLTNDAETKKLILWVESIEVQ